MESRIIRQTFLDFFQKHHHKIVASSPIVVKNDPTLMFTNAGMNQFKDYFLGNKQAEIKRVADTQKCLRVSGKHNDLEEVGTDGYHHTMFEMLGNWSFGDYFKKEAIDMAWNLLTKEYGLNPDRLYVSVFGGDESEKLASDEEAKEYWKVYLPESRILYFNKKDNFWEMGDTGPCGPCSEIHVDLRPDNIRTEESGAALVNVGTPEVMEIWNLVFIQYNRKADGSLEELPDKHVDTGMGFERISMVLQDKKSSYDTDIFRDVIQFIEKESGFTYTASYDKSAKTDLAMRVLADHLRAVSFAIADGALPSNTGSGYVIRRILRRAVRYYFSFLNIKEAFLYKLIPILSKQMGSFFPELIGQKDFIMRVMKEEEQSFLRTLDDGLKRMDNLQVTNNIIPGKTAFELYDTFGFPIDLTRLIANERGYEVDEVGFNQALEEQKERSRASAKTEYSDWTVLHDGETKFVGYDEDVVDHVQLLRWRKVESKGQTQFQLVCNVTPFYPDGGGQVGDTGYIISGNEKIQVLDTQKENDLIIHITEHIPADTNLPLRLEIDAAKRKLTENNHSATHLVHAALRSVLGTHVQQRGSMLNDQYLRFDFSHFQKMTDDEITVIEQIVNQRIRQNISMLESRNIAIAEAKEAGAMMLFGEKYGETVRMITFDPTYSRELCGGCHVKHTGQIGLFKIIGETAVAAGIRRIEAVTSISAETYINAKLHELHQIKTTLKNPKDVKLVIENLQEENKELKKEIDHLKLAQANNMMQELKQNFIKNDGVHYLIRRVPFSDSKIAKQLMFQLDKEVEHAVMVWAFEEQNKAQLMILINEQLVKSKGWNAGQLVKQFATAIDGGGGGQAFFASAGGKKISGIQVALNDAATFFGI